jgi:hypothetical protein
MKLFVKNMLGFLATARGRLVRLGLAMAMFLGMVVSVFADGPAAPDPTATISSLTSIWYSVGAVAITILLWNVGRRLVNRFFK